MTKKRHRINAETVTHTYAYLRTVAWASYQRADNEYKGSKLFAASSMVFSAFSVEAFLNYAGSELIRHWEFIERKLTTREKLDLIAKELGHKIDYGARPFQTFVRMFAFRNSLAHGRSEELTEESIQLLSADQVPELPQTEWEEEISVDNAKRYLDDSKDMIVTLSEMAGIEPALLFTPGEAEWLAAPDE